MGKLAGILLMIVAVVLFIISLRVMDIQIQSVPIKCFVDNVLVYDGPSVGINVTSTGRTTRVDIHGGFLYLLPKAYYVSDNVRLAGDKRVES